MAVSLHETCLQYFNRRLSEGWKCTSLEGYDAVLLSPDGIRRRIDLRNDVETLRPNASGEFDDAWSATGCDNNSYTCVDEASQDGNTTHLRSKDVNVKNLWNIENTALTDETITKITLYAWCQRHGSGFENGYIGIKSGTTYDWGSEITFTASFVEYTREFLQDPDTSAAWTTSGLNALLIGIRNLATDPGTDCTQIYVEVDYTEPGWSGGDVGGVAIATIAKINGVALADIVKVNGVAQCAQ